MAMALVVRELANVTPLQRSAFAMVEFTALLFRHVSI